MASGGVKAAAERSYNYGGDKAKKGQKYELDLALALFLRSTFYGSSFELAIQMKAAGKFDDVVLFVEELKEVWLFQAKCRQIPGSTETKTDEDKMFSRISYKDLFPENSLKKSDFSLCMYLQSYLDIQKGDTFKGYKIRLFIYTNKSLDDWNSVAHQNKSFRTQNDKKQVHEYLSIKKSSVHNILAWVDGEKYYNFDPKSDEAISILRVEMNVEVTTLKNAVISLFDKGQVLDVLVKYSTPLRSILEISDKKLRFTKAFLGKEESKILISGEDRKTQTWLLHELQNHFIGEDLEKIERDVNQNITKLNKNSRDLHLPKCVEKNDVKAFFECLTLCAEQPDDLQGVIDECVNLIMAKFILPDDRSKVDESHFNQFRDMFESVFHPWQLNMQQDHVRYLSTEDGIQCEKQFAAKLRLHLSKINEIYFQNYIDRKLKKADSNSSTSMREQDFVLSLTDKGKANMCHVLVGEPGMGKSTFLNKIAFELQKDVRNHVYVIKLNNLYKKRPLVQDVDVANCLQTTLPKSNWKCLERSLEQGDTPITLLLDGFDEMHPSYRSAIITITRQMLDNSKVQTIIISGRKHVQKLLERELLVESRVLVPLEIEEQIQFMNKIWMVPIDEESQTKFQVFAHSLLQQFHEKINSIFSFAGLPLLIRMLADVYHGNFTKYISSKNEIMQNESNLPGALTLLSLFEKFVKKSFNMKMKRILKENAYIKFDTYINSELDFMYEQYVLEHQMAAIQQLSIKRLRNVFDHKYFSKIHNLFMQRIREGNENSFLVNIGNKVEFIHLSFAEYFAAKYLYEYTEDYEKDLLVILTNFEVIRRFFLLMVEENFDKNSKHTKIIEGICEENSVVLDWACMEGNQNLVKRLIENMSLETKRYGSLFHTAVNAGSESLILFFLPKTDIEYENENKQTALHVASGIGNEKIIKLLNEHGANIKAVDKDGNLPLHIAARRGHKQIVEMLINDSSVNVGNNFDQTPLHLAAENGHLGMLSVLINEHKANVEVLDCNGRTALHLASGNGHCEIVQSLINKNNANTSDHSGNTLLHMAAKGGHLELANMLLNSSLEIDINSVNINGHTPLLTAANNNRIEMAEMLKDASGQYTLNSDDKFCHTYFSFPLFLDFLGQEVKGCPKDVTCFYHIMLPNCAFQCNELFLEWITKKQNIAFCELMQSFLRIKQEHSFEGHDIRFDLLTNDNLHYDGTWKPMEGKVASFRSMLNVELLAIKDDIIELFEKGSVSDLLRKYSFPLRDIFELKGNWLHYSKKFIKCKKTIKNNSSLVWLSGELKNHYKQKLCIFDRCFRRYSKMESICIQLGEDFHSILQPKYEKANLPLFVNDDDIDKFLRCLTVHIIQSPPDNVKVEDVNYLRQWIPPDYLGKLTISDVERVRTIFECSFQRWFHSKKIETNGHSPYYLSTEGLDVYVPMIENNLNNFFSVPLVSQRHMYITRNAVKSTENSITVSKSDYELIQFIIDSDSNDRCLILSGAPGVGKTTLLQFIGFEVQKRTDINVYLMNLKNLRLNHGERDGARFFQGFLSEMNLNILQNCLQFNHSRVLILLDGFDELNSNLKSYVFAFIKNTLLNENVQIVVSGRTHVSDTLENQLKVKAFHLVPLENEEYLKILVNLWKVSNHNTKFHSFATRMLNNFKAYTMLCHYDFIGFHLMVQVMAEVFFADFNEILKSDNDDSLHKISSPEAFKINTLFEKFIKKSKHDENFIQLAAIKLLSMEQLLHSIDCSEYTKQEKCFLDRVEKSILINTSIKTHVEFTHPSHAKYLVAKYLYDNVNVDRQLLFPVLAEHEEIRYFYFLQIEENYDSSLAQLKTLVDLNNQHQEVIFWLCHGGIVKSVKHLFNKCDLTSNKQQYIGTLLHVAVSRGLYDLVLFLLHECHFDADHKADILAAHLITDTVQVGDRALHVAVKMDHVKITTLLTQYTKNICATNEKGETPFDLAMERDNLEIIRLLLDNSQGHIDAACKTFLHKAVLGSYTNTVELLIAMGANVNICNDRGMAPLHTAVENGHFKVVRLLIEHGADVHQCNSDQMIPLHFACQEGSLDIAKFLIGHGANVHVCNSVGTTPLHLACQEGHLAITKLLIEHRAKVDVCDKYDQTPLYLATLKDQLDIANLLMEHGANVHMCTPRGVTPLHLACQEGHLEIAKLLIEHNAKVNVWDGYNRTPLYLATLKGQLDIANLLMEHGANVHMCTPRGVTPLHLACQEGHLEIAKLLIEHGAEVDVSDRNTLLFLATKNGHSDIAKLLMKRGANVRRCNLESLLDLACQEGHLEIAKLLIEHGAKVNVSDRNSLLSLATKNGHSDIVKLLTEHGAHNAGIFFSGLATGRVLGFRPLPPEPKF